MDIKKKAYEVYPEQWFRDIDGDSYDANARERFAYYRGLKDMQQMMEEKKETNSN